VQDRSSQLSRPIPARPASGRWRRFWRPSTVSGDRQTPVGNLPWRDLLNRRDALILDIGPARAAGHSDVLQIALIDTTGAARFAARFAAKGTSADVVPWSEVHDPLVRALEGAGVVLVWDAPWKVRLLARIVRRHGLPPPTVPWRDLRAEYRKLGYVNDSLTSAARLHAAGGVIPGPLVSCYRALAVMDTCGN